ncbi:MAG TPA: TerC family protein [Pirellulales bacterium]|nr:TerC family protein [Pirellulales bacterium]
MIEFTLWYWLGFGALVTTLLAIDLGLFNRKSRDRSIREAAISTAVWCCLALAFNAYILQIAGRQKAGEFLTGYLVEWALSMDNVFVFAVIFNYFRVPVKYQYRVLFWGIILAVVFRLAFILVGIELIEMFGWIIYLLGAFLIYTGFKLVLHDEDFDPDTSLVIRVSRRLFRISREDHGERFLVRENGLRCITPLFLVLLVINVVDVVFALDSVPAIIGITQDRFIVFTSNIFAILGLRALYFLLAGAMEMFRYLRYGLAAILVFVGVKMLVQKWLEEKVLHREIPVWVPLIVVVAFLAIAVAASVIAARRDAYRERPTSEADEPTDESDDESGGANGRPLDEQAAMRDRIDSA